MDITVFRIDDRLIHGQVATSWSNYSNAEQIVIADDDVMDDTLQQSLLKMATPKGIDLKLLSLEDAKEELESGTNDGIKTLFLTRGPVEANEILRDNTTIDEINIGNLNMRKGKEKVLDNLWVFPEDIEAFNELDNKGIMLEYRTLPNDKKQSVMPLIEKLN